MIAELKADCDRWQRSSGDGRVYDRGLHQSNASLVVHDVQSLAASSHSIGRAVFSIDLESAAVEAFLLLSAAGRLGYFPGSFSTRIVNIIRTLSLMCLPISVC